MGETLAASARAAVQSAADLIRARSPGLRTQAHLIKIKYAPRPVARAKPRIRRPAVLADAPLLAPPPPPIPIAFTDQAFAPAYVTPTTFPVPSIEDAAPCPCGFAYIPPLSGGGGVVFGPGGGGPGGGGGGGGGETPPGVPEPSTWALMIIGLGAIGAIWRRRRILWAAIKRIPLLVYRHLPLLAYAPR